MTRIRDITRSIMNVLLPVLLSFAICAILILIAGKNPLKVYWTLISKSLLSKEGLLHTLSYASPLIMTGLALAISFKAQIINMGVEGQLYIGAFIATWAGFTFTGLPKFIHLPLCLILAMFSGSVYAYIAGVLKAFFHINEIVVTLMLNYIAIIFTRYLTSGPFKQNIGYTATARVLDSAMLQRITQNTQLSTAIIFALALVPLFWIIYNKTKLGFEINFIGKNIGFADATGMNVKKKILIIMLISGAVAGLAGSTEILGVYRRFTPDFSSNPGLGWDGMLVALLGGNNPIGVFVAAIFFGALKYGSTTLQTFEGVPYDIINVLQSLIILFLSIRFIKENPAVIKRLKLLIQKKSSREKEVA